MILCDHLRCHQHCPYWPFHCLSPCSAMSLECESYLNIRLVAPEYHHFLLLREPMVPGPRSLLLVVCCSISTCQMTLSATHSPLLPCSRCVLRTPFLEDFVVPHDQKKLYDKTELIPLRLTLQLSRGAKLFAFALCVVFCASKSAITATTKLHEAPNPDALRRTSR